MPLENAPPAADLLRNITNAPEVVRVPSTVLSNAPAAVFGGTVSAANTDLAWLGGNSTFFVLELQTGGGTLRSIAAPTVSPAWMIIRNTSSPIMLLHNTAGGTGQVLDLNGGVNRFLNSGSDAIILVNDSSFWREVRAAPLLYRKTTAKTVNTTVAATDLLNGEITLPANAMGATGLMRLIAWGDRLDNVGAVAPRFQLLMGATTLIDTGASNGGTSSAARFGWKLVAEVLNLTAGTQVCNLWVSTWNANIPGTQNEVTFTTGSGYYQSRDTHVYGEGSNSGLTVDTTTSKALILNVINGSASASYETRLQGAVVEIL